MVDDGFGSPFTYGIRSMIVDAEGRLVCGTASNFFIVDLLNSPELLAQFKPGELQECLIKCLGQEGYQCLMEKLLECDWKGKCDPWIGCEVFGSDYVIPEPLSMSLLATGAIGLLLRRRRIARV